MSWHTSHKVNCRDSTETEQNSIQLLIIKCAGTTPTRSIKERAKYHKTKYTKNNPQMVAQRQGRTGTSDIR